MKRIVTWISVLLLAAGLLGRLCIENGGKGR